jgi:hypothetical protein
VCVLEERFDQQVGTELAVADADPVLRREHGGHHEESSPSMVNVATPTARARVRRGSTS